MRRLSMFLVPALLGVALLAGCGSGGKSSSSGSTGNAETAPRSQSSTAAGGAASNSGGTTGGGAAASGGATTKAPGTTAAHPSTPKEQVETCTRIIQAPSAIPASAKAKLLKSCEQVGGNTSAQHRVVHEACEAIANTQPAGVSRERALAICRRAP